MPHNFDMKVFTLSHNGKKYKDLIIDSHHPHFLINSFQRMSYALNEIDCRPIYMCFPNILILIIYAYELLIS
jgi:hypothetical protein